MELIPISTMEEYNYCVSGGYTPLLNKNFDIEIALRVEIQKELFGNFAFGKINIPTANDKFYHWVWDNKQNICEECIQPLHEYSATYISHILTKGAKPQMAHDPRNTNILCFWCHNRWENGNRTGMRIYPKNKLMIEKLKNEYNSL